MAKFDQGGGCACGVQMVCDCERANGGLSKAISKLGRGSPTTVLPTPFDVASIKPPHGEMDGSGKFSPNLYRWMAKKWGGRFGGRGLEQVPSVFKDSSGTLWIGRMDETGGFIGQRLSRVLCYPTAEIYAWTKRSHPGMKPVPNFWRAYRRLGRCSIDPKHTTWFLHDDARWDIKGKTRTCRWCGSHKQVLKVRTEVTRVKVKTWEAA